MAKNPSKLSGYLVLAVCNFDDIPVGIYATEKEAIAKAKRTTKAPRANVLETWDVTNFLGAKVLKFVNGKPNKIVYNSLNDEDDGAAA